MANRLKDKIAIITGAARGIGAKSAQLFAAEGAAVAIWDLNTERGKETAQQIQDSGGTAIFCKCDVTDAAQIEDTTQHVTSELGTPNVLFNNAGIAVVGELEHISEGGLGSAVCCEREEYLSRLTSDYPVDACCGWRFHYQYGE